MEGRRVLEMGPKWKICNGFKEDVWEHKWLNKPPLFKPERRGNQNGAHLKVADLIEQSTRTWKADLVPEYFTPKYATLILV